MSRAVSPFVAAVEEQAQQQLQALPGAQLDWLMRARQKQLAALMRDGLPTSKTEEWKYTALRALERQQFVHGDRAAADHVVDPALFDLPGVDGPRLVLVNGVFRRDLSSLGELPYGVEVIPLAQALAENSEPLRFFLTRDWDKQADAFARLNAAFASDGVVLRIKDGVQMTKPVHFITVGAATTENIAWHARNIIEVGEGASLSLIEHHLDAAANANLGTLITDATVKQKGRLDWVMLQDLDTKCTLMRKHSVRQHAQSEVSIHTFEGGGKLTRNDLDISLIGEGAKLHTRGVFLPHGRQHMDTHLDINHDALNTSSDALWRGVADQGGRGVFHGQINVAPGADGTDASLYNKNLLLSRKAAIDTQPALEIYAEEVMAMHGATVGQLDDKALFYMRSRGIPAEAARNILTAAFCREALADIALDPLREYLEQHLIDVLPNLEAV